MVLTRMELDTSKRKTVKALAAPNLFHGALESAFPERERLLWRVDRLADKTYLLVVSETQPDFSAAAEQFGTNEGWRSLDYSAFIENIRKGDRRRFRLTANPVVTKSAGSGNRGSVMAHLTPEQQEAWLFARAEKNGFSLTKDEYRVVESAWVSFRKCAENGRQVTFRRVTFEGLLTVTDEELFRSAMQNGIGREKAYGCGMLTVTRALE